MNFFCVDKTLGVNWSVESTAMNMSQHEEIAGDLLRPELLLAGQAETVIKEVSITKRRGTKKIDEWNFSLSMGVNFCNFQLIFFLPKKPRKVKKKFHIVEKFYYFFVALP